MTVERLGIVLAAGAGSRMGGPKAMLEFEGAPLLERAVRTAFAGGCDRVLAILGARLEAAAPTARRTGAEVVPNPRWSEGMGTSLAVGIAEAAARSTATAALITLVDQPFVTAAAVTALWAAQPDPADAAVLAAAAYRGRRGHPVLIGRRHWPALLPTLVADTGARDYLRAHRDALVLVPCDELASPQDLDTPQDLAAAAALG
jgi:nicotine blue oxidoreductase